MDLIKILSVDLQNNDNNSTGPLGLLSGGRINIRGRLIPITLELDLWPRGVVRKHNLVQFWAGSVLDPPVRETFLVPVLFIRWGDCVRPCAHTELHHTRSNRNKGGHSVESVQQQN